LSARVLLGRIRLPISAYRVHQKGIAIGEREIGGKRGVGSELIGRA
jgi:hypothetical protein